MENFSRTQVKEKLYEAYLEKCKHIIDSYLECMNDCALEEEYEKMYYKTIRITRE